MTEVRVLVGTVKGAFVLRSDGSRKKWTIEGPHLGGWQVMHVKGSPVDPGPDLVCNSQGSAGRWRPLEGDRGAPSAGPVHRGADDPVTAVWVALPTHLRRLARVGAEVVMEVDGLGTIGSVMDALERAHPTLRGTIRDHGGGPRRAYMRYFVCGEDFSHLPRSFGDQSPPAPAPRPCPRQLSIGGR